MMSDDNSSRETHFSDATSLPSSARTSNPKPVETWSVFGDGACGEPMVAQHLTLDFTRSETDTDFIQKKVCSFWKFINNNPEIQNLKVKPDKCGLYGNWSETSTDVKPQPKEKVVDVTKTACSMIEIVEGKDLIKSAFKTKLADNVNSLGSYKEEESIQQKKKARHTPVVCRCAKPCKPCPVKKSAPSALKQMCTELEKWDTKHPKSMAPPGRSPAVQHCTIQRQVFES